MDIMLIYQNAWALLSGFLGTPQQAALNFAGFFVK
jgi:hypothetical protein